MTQDGWAHSAVRHNPYAGVREQELHEALNANPYSITDAHNAWAEGANDLDALATDLKKQKDLIREVYQGAGEEAALVYERMETMVRKRQQEMLDVAEGLEQSHDAVNAARAAYENLPSVRPPSDGSLPAALPMGATAKEKKKHAKEVEQQKTENATADAAHEADKRAAEAKAVEALGVLDTALNGSADKMRGVAGMEKPTGPNGPGSSVPTSHVLPAVSSPKSQPHVISAPHLDPGPTTQPPTPTNQPPTQPPPTQVPPTLPPPTEVPHPTNPPVHHTPPPPPGVLLGPGDNASPHTLPTSLGPSTTSTSSTVTGVGVSAVAPTSLAASAIRNSSVTPLPGTTSARGATLGRSSAPTPARGALGRNTMMPGQAAARGAAGGRSGGRMMPGQGGAGSRGRAGSRGAMAPGTGGRGKGGRNSKDEQDKIDLLWDDGDEWLGDDDTAPQTLS